MTLTDGTTTITLPDALPWTDQHAWSPVEQSAEHSITGALIVQVATRQAGRPITLDATEKNGWKDVTLAKVAQLETWAATPGQQLTLTIGRTAYGVIFRHHDAPAFSARPLGDYTSPDPAHPYLITAKFMVI